MAARNWKNWLLRLRGEGQPSADREIDEEVAFHLAMEADKHRRQGLNARQALRRARLSFGGVESFKEACRDERTGSQLDMLMQDVRYALRTLGKNWGFAATVVLTLALGIGANSAVFSIIYGVLLRPLPYQRGDRLVLLQQSNPAAGTSSLVSIAELYDYREQSGAFAELVEYHTMFFVLLGRGEPERVETGVVSDNFFDTLGVAPLLGRTFVEGEDDLDADAVLVLSYGYWRDSFGADADIIGKVFEMNNRPHTVVGVLPPIPQFPTEVDVYMPTSACPFRANAERDMAGNHGRFRMLTVFGRLAEGATVARADAEIDAIAGRFASDFPDAYSPERGFDAGVVDLKEELTREARPVLLMLLATAGLVLLIACANVANLSLARVMRRQQEIAVRAALGASRARLMRQLLTESTVLALIGGALGLAFAYVGLDILVQFASRYTPRAAAVGLDGWVLVFTLAVSVGTGLVFGSFPALPGTRDVGGAIKEGTRATTRGGLRLRRALIVAQVALSFVLLVGAGLTLRSLTRLQAIDPGFDTEQVLTARVSMNWSAYGSMMDAHHFLEELTAAVADSPLVRAAALTQTPPYRSRAPFLLPFSIEGRPAEDTQAPPELDSTVITPQYFEVLGISVTRGRVFDSRDEPESTPVAVINETMAALYWTGEDPVGARISTDKRETWITVIGVVGDTRPYGPATPVTPVFYRPFAQAGMPTWLMIRTVGDPASAAQAVKDIAYALSDANPISDLQPLATLRADAVASPRLTASLLGVFAVLALIVTFIGITGVVAFTITQRTRELGLRMALGAQRPGILSMVVRQEMVQVAAGLVLGIAGAIAFGRLFSGLLFEVQPVDPATFVVVVAVLAAGALVAVVIPARRAVGVNPVIALRSN